MRCECRLYCDSNPNGQTLTFFYLTEDQCRNSNNVQWHCELNKETSKYAGLTFRQSTLKSFT